MANKTIRKVTKVDSQIPRMKGVDYKIDKMNNVYQVKKKSKEQEKEEATLNELARDVIEMVEDVEFTGVGPSIMADEPTYNRMTNNPAPPQLVASRGDTVRNVGDSLTNASSSMKQYSDMDASKDLLDDDEFDLDQDFEGAIEYPGSNNRGLVRPDKYITDYRGDGLDYGATHSESFTGTAAIALAPAAFGVDTRKSNKRAKKKTKLENAMNRKRLVREYSPDFAAGSYKPGDAKMNKKGGKGLQSPSLGNIGHKSESELTSHGEQWPRKKSRNVAMSDVDDNGVDGGPQGSHKSSVGKPDDGYQTSVGHDWPAKPKNRGGTAAMKGSRYSDGGVLGGGSNVEESWSPSRIGHMMGEEMNIQSLFDQYAKHVQKVTQNGFGSLCEAYGQNISLDRDVMLNLMDRNRDFVFYEDEDSDGSYWVPEDGDEDMDSMDGDMDDMDGDMDAMDGELTDDEHHDMHGKLKAFCEKYGCPEDELHDLCHKYAQEPMDEIDDEDFDDEESEDFDDMGDDMGDGPDEESWGEGEGMASESWGEGADEGCMGEGEGTGCESWAEGEDEFDINDMPAMNRREDSPMDAEYDDEDDYSDDIGNMDSEYRERIGPGDDGYDDEYRGDNWRDDAMHTWRSQQEGRSAKKKPINESRRRK